MHVRYVFVNRGEIPKLDPNAEYITEVISVEWDSSGYWLIKLKFLGEKFDRNNSSTPV